MPRSTPPSAPPCRRISTSATSRAQTTTLVDRDSGANGTIPAFSTESGVTDADGGRVAFVTKAPLAGAPADNKAHVYLRDLGAATTTLVSRADGAGGASADDDSRSPAIDAAGDLVAFGSSGSNLGVPGTPQRRVYARDITGAHTELVSFPADAATPIVTTTFADARRSTRPGTGSRSGHRTADAEAPDQEIYVRDRDTQTTTLVSRADGPDGAPADDGPSIPSISAAGDCVAFAAAATNLGDGFAQQPTSLPCTCARWTTRAPAIRRPARGRVAAGGGGVRPAGRRPDDHDDDHDHARRDTGRQRAVAVAQRASGSVASAAGRRSASRCRPPRG